MITTSLITSYSNNIYNEIQGTLTSKTINNKEKQPKIQTLTKQHTTSIYQKRTNIINKQSTTLITLPIYLLSHKKTSLLLLLSKNYMESLLLLNKKL